MNGQKIWQTWGQHSDWMFTLVRTDPHAEPQQAGISFLLIELDTPGVNVRPINTIAGDDEFAEVFLDEVEVPPKIWSARSMAAGTSPMIFWRTSGSALEPAGG